MIQDLTENESLFKSSPEIIIGTSNIQHNFARMTDEADNSVFLTEL